MTQAKKSVPFTLEPEVELTPPRPSGPRKSTLRMAQKIFETYQDDQVTDEMLVNASKLFTENYGIWSEDAAQLMGAFAKPGKPVKLSKTRLREEYLPPGTSTYIRVLVDGTLAGNAFTCRWNVNGETVCWITQLVVHRDYRQRRLASGLLSQAEQEGDHAYGVMSSHPAACLAAIGAFKSSLNPISLDFMRTHAQSIVAASPISYIREAKLVGSLFNSGDDNSMIAAVDTAFFVDHSEPLEALSWAKENLDWPLGDLCEGHEFLLILPARARPCSRFISRKSNDS